MILISQVRTEDADLLILLIHHCCNTNHPVYFSTSKGTFDMKDIREMLTERQRRYLLFCLAFTGCDSVSAIAGHGKSALFDKFCSGDIGKYMDIFLDL